MKRFSKCLTVLVILVVCVFSFAACGGKSAYEIAVDNGFSGTEQEWLASLHGSNGSDGADGKDLNLTLSQDGYETWLLTNPGKSYEDYVSYVLAHLAPDSDAETAAINRAALSVVKIVTNVTGGTVNGSGVIFAGDKSAGEAYIVTNYHVLYSGGLQKNNIYVYLYGRELSSQGIKATYIGGSLKQDIAVIRISSQDYATGDSRPVSIANSDEVVMGNRALAVGNPEGFGIAATSGIVSKDSEVIQLYGADDRTVISLRVMRVDTAINGGNSGGGLFDIDGNLIGIVNAKSTKDNVENVSYAIPSDIAIPLAERIVANYRNGVAEGSRANKCVLGVTVTASDSDAVYNAETKRTELVETVQIASVERGSAAASAGIQSGDILVSASLNGRTIAIRRTFDLSDFLYYGYKGDVLTLTVNRNNATQTISVTLPTPTPLD